MNEAYIIADLTLERRKENANEQTNEASALNDGLVCHVCNENERGYFWYGAVTMYGCAQCGIGIIYGANKYQPTANEAKEIYEKHIARSELNGRVIALVNDTLDTLHDAVMDVPYDYDDSKEIGEQKIKIQDVWDCIKALRLDKKKL